ncbi:MAG TPA: pilus assembly protein PilM [Polyangia bacterium]|nr:pilus assembly protein PilM [Polyangia bacterium]
MAHKILGIDLGAYSVKIAELSAGFRQSQLTGLYERPLLPALEGESALARAARTAAELIADEKLQAEMFATSLGGEATLRLLTMPFSDPKKIEQVLGYELESQILGELDGLVYDSVISTTRLGEGGTSTTNVIAVAAQKETVKERVDALAAIGAEPRVIGAAALSYAALRGHAFAGDGAGGEGETQAIVDFGHRHTNVCVVRAGTVLFARSIPRGGEDVTLAISDQFRMSMEDAISAKHAQAFLAAPGSAFASPAHARVDAVVREALRPLMRELKQTLAAYRAAGETGPDRVLVTGGAARLQGFVEHVEAELGVVSARLGLIADDPFLDPAMAERARAGEGMVALELPAQALGLALAAAAPVPQVNLRKSDLAYRTDYSYLRGKSGYLAAAVLAILAFAAINAAASLRGLRKEGEALETRLRKQTIELFGEARIDGKAVSEELHSGPKGGFPPVPTMTAYDILDEISRHVPPGDKGKLDITELEIKPKKIYMKGTVETASQVDDLAAELDKIECFETPEKGKISSVTAPPSGDPPATGEKPQPRELKQFDLTIATTCP